jgi:hypothetical protein
MDPRHSLREVEDDGLHLTPKANHERQRMGDIRPPML